MFLLLKTIAIFLTLITRIQRMIACIDLDRCVFVIEGIVGENQGLSITAMTFMFATTGVGIGDIRRKYN